MFMNDSIKLVHLALYTIHATWHIHLYTLNTVQFGTSQIWHCTLRLSCVRSESPLSTHVCSWSKLIRMRMWVWVWIWCKCGCGCECGCGCGAGVEEANQREAMLIPKRLTRPRMRFGGSLDDLKKHLNPEAATLSDRGSVFLSRLVGDYAQESYVLAPDSSLSTFLVLYKEGADSKSILRSIWQAEWILQHGHAHHQASESPHFPGPGNAPVDDQNGASPQNGGLTHGTMDAKSSLDDAACRMEEGTDMQTLDAVKRSLAALQVEFPGFVAQLEGKGWDTESPILKVKANSHILIYA